MFLREPKSLLNSVGIGFDQLQSSRFETTAQNRPQTFTSQSSFQNFQNRLAARNFNQDRNSSRRPNDILTRTQRLKSLTSSRNSIISAGTRNAGILPLAIEQREDQKSFLTKSFFPPFQKRNRP